MLKNKANMQRCMLGGAASTLRAFRASTSVSARMFRYDAFADRHIGPSRLEKQQMLDFLGFTTLDKLTNSNVPNQIKLERELDLPEAADEYSMLRELKKISEMNKVYRSYIGMGYYDTIVPAVILRNITQNIGWISQYTPYQAEISQGRLESLLNFQTMVADLTGLPSTNASLLDESTAVAEAIALATRATKKNKVVLLDPYLHPQNIDVAKTRSEALGIELKELNFDRYNVDSDVAAVVVQYPDTEGRIRNLDDLIYKAHEQGALVVLVSDLMALTLLKSPGDLGADVAVGSAQRFGVPLGYGGPHPGFMAVAKDAKNTLGRMMPGRIIGVTRYFTDGSVGVSLDETTKPADILDILYVFNGGTKLSEKEVAEIVPETASPLIGNSHHGRTTSYLEHPIFNTYHSEAQLVRYIKRLENKDVSLAHSMIPLGSCTMKLNASSQLIPITWETFNGLHPFAPVSQAAGYQRIFSDVERWLCEITGYDSFSLQPNSGANGEYAGLLTIRKYHIHNGQEQRNSARYKDELAAIMVTYPSTHGVFESSIRDVCDKVHEHGGQVYLDGANMNAQVGLCRPGDYGSDVSHLNLHKRKHMAILNANYMARRLEGAYRIVYKGM
ncbi:glycine dehydrogenase [Teladorsagia circumcincta]|uniref:Glycine dehydrogenase n=1 Tax=Teladorsagia circumcincta TaxID=45464 RepID=A0A2G9UDI7_TELCI|nr:glycine dehydrogenase [Teladorsagia circumcincta]